MCFKKNVFEIYKFYDWGNDWISKQSAQDGQSIIFPYWRPTTNVFHYFLNSDWMKKHAHYIKKCLETLSKMAGLLKIYNFIIW